MEIDVSSILATFNTIAGNRERALRAAGLTVLAAAQQSIKDSGPGWAPFKKPPKRPHQLLWETGTLIQSLSLGNANNVAQVSDTGMVVGTNVVYARAQNLGYAPHNLPARPFLFVDDARTQKAIQAYSAQLLQGI